MKRALITGVYGMVGSHMADFLLNKGYEVYGTSRNINNPTQNIEESKNKVKLIQADLNDQSSLFKAVEISNPDEIYNFGAVSFSPNSWLTRIVKLLILKLEKIINGLPMIKLIPILKIKY